jgi:hypothetical protein
VGKPKIAWRTDTRLTNGLEIASNEYIGAFQDIRRHSACSRSQKTSISKEYKHFTFNISPTKISPMS